MVVYRLGERSPISGAKEKHSSAGPKHRWLGAHGQVEIAAMGLMALVLAAGAFVLGDIDGDEQVFKIVAGDNITISPENGYGIVTINSTGISGNGAVSDNNVVKIVAGDNIAISPENGYGEVTITATGYDNTQNVQQIIAGENITVSPESGYGEVTVGVLIDNIRPSQLHEAPVPGDDGKFPQYEESNDMFSWVTIDRGLVVVADVLITEACSSVAITDLNLDVDKLYVLEMMLVSNTASGTSLNIDFNEDTDGDHYYVQWFRGNDTTISGEREHRRSLGWGINPYSNSLIRFDIMRPFETGTVTMWGGLILGPPSSIQTIFIGRQWTESTNLTRVDIVADTANAITSGSRIILLTVGSG